MPRRVFLGLTEVAGYFGSLRRGLEEAGIPAVFIDESGDPFSYGLARRPFPALHKTLIHVHGLLADPEVRGVHRAALRIVALILKPVKVAYRLSLLTWAAVTCDVFIFGGEQSFLRGYRDLALLNRLGKSVVWVFTGSDHRPPYLNGRLVRQAGTHGGTRALAAAAARISSRVWMIEKQVVTVGHVASAQFHTRPFIDLLAVGLPVWREFPPVRHRLEVSPVRVLHSPSDPVSKGSGTIREVVDELKAQGLAIDYREISGRPNAEVLAAIAESDIVVDELYSDTPMAILACEAAHLGRPTLVGGYYASERSGLSAEARPPTAYVVPAALASTLATLVTDAPLRRKLGQEARTFVETAWEPAMVARRLLNVAAGRAPAEWMVDPATLRYVHGWGMSEATVASALAGYLEAEGRDALRLNHNRTLVDRILALAGGLPAGDRKQDPGL